MDYRKYSAEDFALDERFQKWVLNPDTELDGFWNDWRRQNPGKNQVLDDAAGLVRAAGLSNDAAMNQAYLEVWQALERNAGKSASSHSGNWKLVKIAAAVALLIAASVVLWRISYVTDEAAFQTAFGEVRAFTLEDGSTVTLNSNSRLYVASNWSQRSVREVMLEGEGFFNVVKTPDAKGFEVTTKDNVSISVLGTKFNVNTRHEEVKVYLESGKVRVNAAGSEALLNPGDFVVYKNEDASLTVNRSVNDSSALLSWREEVFIFNDAPLSEVITELEDNYGFTVVVKEKNLYSKRITAKVPRNDVNVLLDVLSETLEMKIERDGSQLILR